MHDGIHTPHDMTQLAAIGNIAHYQLKTVSQKGMPAREVVVDENLISLTVQSAGRVAPDVACSTNY
jgi:hypothetical protein